MPGRNITKKEVAQRIAVRVKMNAVQTAKIIQMFLESIIEGLAEGARFELRDFGVFEIVERKAKKARNPKTGETVMVPLRKR